MLSLNFDLQNDILYIGLGDRSFSYGDETPEGVVILHDLTTEEITGITILDFKKKYLQNRLPSLHLPISIDFARDIIPKIKTELDYLNLSP